MTPISAATFFLVYWPIEVLYWSISYVFNLLFSGSMKSELMIEEIEEKIGDRLSTLFQSKKKSTKGGRGMIDFEK